MLSVPMASPATSNGATTTARVPKRPARSRMTAETSSSCESCMNVI